jgi:hypothetical protein
MEPLLDEASPERTTPLLSRASRRNTPADQLVGGQWRSAWYA